MSPRYEILLLDADQTLLDFNAAEDSALKTLFSRHDFELTPAKKERYLALNRQLWQDYELGKISRDHVVNSRFATFLGWYGRQVDGRAWESEYRALLGEGYQLLPGALQTCWALSQVCRLYIVTNGVAKTQRKRLNRSGLLQFFQEIFISEEIGFPKPMEGFFSYVFSHIPNFRRESALLVGDSLTSDILGGINSGLDTCWLNASGQAPADSICPTFEISNISQLSSVVLPR